MRLNLVTKVCFLCASSMVAVVTECIVCEVRAEQEKSRMVPTVTIWPYHCSGGSRRAGFNPRSVHVGFMVDKEALDRIFPESFSFPLSISFHRSPILILIYMLLLP